MNNAVTRKLLLLAVLLHAAFSSLADVKECDVSLFANSVIVILGRFGIIWVDGFQESLEELNNRLEEQLRRSFAYEDATYALRWDTAKLFYTSTYSHVLVTGVNFVKGREKFKRFQIGVLNTTDLLTHDSGFRKLDKVIPEDSYSRRFCGNVSPFKSAYVNIVEGNEIGNLVNVQKICDSRTITFVPAEDRFVVDVNKTMTLYIQDKPPSYRSEPFVLPQHCLKRKVDVFMVKYSRGVPDECSGNKDAPHEMVADFNNELDSNGQWRLHCDCENETRKGNEKETPFFYNQLESGKFKLKAELFIDESGIEWYYHILTRLSPYSIMQEMEKCYIRKFKKEKVNDKYSIKDQPIEFPRMLLIPKSAGPEGVPIPRLTTPAPAVENETLFYPTVPPEIFANLTMFNSTALPELFANVTIATAPTPTPESGSAPITTASLLLLAAVFIANN